MKNTIQMLSICGALALFTLPASAGSPPHHRNEGVGLATDIVRLVKTIISPPAVVVTPPVVTTPAPVVVAPPLVATPAPVVVAPPVWTPPPPHHFRGPERRPAPPRPPQGGRR